MRCAAAAVNSYSKLANARAAGPHVCVVDCVHLQDPMSFGFGYSKFALETLSHAYAHE